MSHAELRSKILSDQEKQEVFENKFAGFRLLVSNFLLFLAGVNAHLEINSEVDVDIEDIIVSGVTILAVSPHTSHLNSLAINKILGRKIVSKNFIYRKRKLLE